MENSSKSTRTINEAFPKNLYIIMAEYLNSPGYLYLSRPEQLCVAGADRLHGAVQSNV